MLLFLALLAVAGQAGFGQTAPKGNGPSGPIEANSLVSTALIRPLLFDPDLVMRRPTPLMEAASVAPPQVAPVYLVLLSPAIHAGRTKAQRKPLTLKIQRHLSPVRWVQPADALHDSALLKRGLDSPVPKGQP